MSLTRDPIPPPDLEADRFHHDLSNEFFASCLDATMSYSCAYFENGNETLEEAQIKKMDRALAALELKPGERLLEIGSGWGATAKRARDTYGVEVSGLTLSLNHHAYASKRCEGDPGVRFLVQGWETYGEPCDKIISLGAFEQVTSAKYDVFFDKCRTLLPPSGLMWLHTITQGKDSTALSFGRHVKFMLTKVYPKAEIPRPEDIIASSRRQGFETLVAQSLRFDYARTLEMWAENLKRNREAAIAARDEETYDVFHRYFIDSAKYFRSGEAGSYHFLMRTF